VCFLRGERDSFDVVPTRVEGGEGLRAVVQKATKPLGRIAEDGAPLLGNDGLSALLVPSLPDLEDGRSGFEIAAALFPGGVAAPVDFALYIAAQRGQGASSSANCQTCPGNSQCSFIHRFNVSPISLAGLSACEPASSQHLMVLTCPFCPAKLASCRRHALPAHRERRNLLYVVYNRLWH
jgi:hypothetical protein